jgi:hypothetical protein
MQEESDKTNTLCDIDKLTLEMFMNKQTYRRYVAKTDPTKHAVHEEYMSDLSKYKNSIF